MAWSQESIPRGTRPWRRRRAAFSVTVLLLFIVPIPIFAIAGSTARTAAIDGALVGYGLVVCINSFAEILAPRHYLRWRAWMMEGGPAAYARIGRAFDRRLLPDDGQQAQQSYRRVRLFGFTLLLVNAVIVGLFMWVLAIAGII
jgi:hypothetical protein